MEVMKDLQQRCKRILITTYVLGFLASFSYWNQKGVLPYLTRKLGVTPSVYGYLESSFAFYQMITSPVYGLLADKYGVRFWYIISELAAVVTYGGLVLVYNIPTLFMSRIPALFMHSLQCKYMVITDVTKGEDRATILGRLGVTHGLGMISGSFIGGLVTEAFNEKAVAILAACGNILSVIIIYFFIPKDTKIIKAELDKAYALQKQENVTRNNLEGSLLQSHNVESSKRSDTKRERDSILQSSVDQSRQTKQQQDCIDGDKEKFGLESDEKEQHLTSFHKSNDSNLSGSHNMNKIQTKLDYQNTNFSLCSPYNISATEDVDKSNDLNSKHLKEAESIDHKNDIQSTNNGDSSNLQKCNDGDDKADGTNDENTKINFSLTVLWTTLSITNMKLLLVLKLATTFPFAVLYAMFSVAIMDFYGMGPKVNGYMLSYIGILGILIQGFLVGYLSKKFKDSFSLKLGIGLSLVGYLYLSVSTNIYLLIVFIAPLLIGGIVVHLLLMVIITKVAPAEDTGSALGLVFALHSIVRAVAPTVGGLVLSTIGWPFVGVIGYAIHFLLIGYFVMFVNNSQVDY